MVVVLSLSDKWGKQIIMVVHHLQGILSAASSNFAEVLPASFGGTSRVLIGTGRYHDPVILDGWSGYQYERNQVCGLLQGLYCKVAGAIVVVHHAAPRKTSYCSRLLSIAVHERKGMFGIQAHIDWLLLHCVFPLQILEILANSTNNPVVLSGDIHNAFVWRLIPDNQTSPVSCKFLSR